MIVYFDPLLALLLRSFVAFTESLYIKKLKRLSVLLVCMLWVVFSPVNSLADDNTSSIEKLKSTPASVFDLGSHILTSAFERELAPKLKKVLAGDYSALVMDWKGEVQLIINVVRIDRAALTPPAKSYEACLELVAEVRKWAGVSEETGLSDNESGSAISGILSRGVLSSREERSFDFLVKIVFDFWSGDKNQLSLTCTAPLLHPHGESISIQELK